MTLNFHLSLLRNSDFSTKYLNWLNDEETNFYSYRRNKNFSQKSLLDFLSTVNKDINSSVYFKIINSKNKLHIGNISLTNIDKFSHFAELGILIGEKEFWGKGIGELSVRAVCKFGFNFLNLNRIEIGTYNPAAEKMFKKCGFVVEGIFRNKLKIKSIYYNETKMAILKSDFQTQLRKPCLAIEDIKE